MPVYGGLVPRAGGLPTTHLAASHGAIAAAPLSAWFRLCPSHISSPQAAGDAAQRDNACWGPFTNKAANRRTYITSTARTLPARLLPGSVARGAGR